MANNFDYLFKFIVIGNSNVGKSCLLLRFTEGRYKAEHEPTLGVEFGSKVIRINDLDIKIQIWDTAGQESFKSITRTYYKGSIAALIVFDLTKRETFEDVQKWLHQVKSHSTEKVQLVLVGNKTDLEGRQVGREQAQQFALKHNMAYYETSAKAGDRVEQVFKQTANRIIQKIEKGQINPETESNYGVRIGKKYRKAVNTSAKKLQSPEQPSHRPKEECYC